MVVILAGLTISCSNDAAPDCFKNKGNTVSYEVAVGDFSAINVSAGIEVVINEGSSAKVLIETGENLQGNISAEVVGSELYLKNSTSCNWVRDYNTTTIYVTTPVLTKIYSASQFAVRSQGVLHFPQLTLQSGLFGESASGSFELQLDCDALTVEDNQSSYYLLSGSATNLSVSLYAGDARFDASALTVQKAYIFHRSTNDIILKPQQEVKGTLYSTGNLVLKSQPLLIDVQQLYMGHVVYE